MSLFRILFQRNQEGPQSSPSSPLSSPFSSPPSSPQHSRSTNSSYSSITANQSSNSTNLKNNENNILTTDGVIPSNIETQTESSIHSNTSTLSNKKNPSFIYFIPKEIWKDGIFPFLRVHDFGVLRLTCKLFRFELLTTPYWKQWIPVEQLKTYIMDCRRLGWKETPQFCYFSFKLPLVHNMLKALPPSVKELDLSNCDYPLSVIFSLGVPTTLEKIILPWFSICSDKELYSFVNSLPNTQLEFGNQKNVLYWACFKGYLTVVRLLVEQRRNPKSKFTTLQENFSFPDGETALHVAAQFGRHEIVEYLLQTGSDPDAICSKGESALMRASYYGYYQIVSILLQYSAKKEIKNKFGKTALDYAQQQGHQQIVELLQQNF